MERYFRKNNNRRSRSQLDFIIQGLMVSNKSHFFALLYQAMIEHPSYVILSDMPQERKLEILNSMMLHYEEREDYEKCAQLKQMQQQVNKNLTC
jgi:hypothetical protein